MGGAEWEHECTNGQIGKSEQVVRWTQQHLGTRRRGSSVRDKPFFLASIMALPFVLGGVLTAKVSNDTLGVDLFL